MCAIAEWREALDQVIAGRDGGGFGAIRGPELVEDAGDVALGSAPPDEERLAYLAVRAAGEEQPQNLGLTRGQETGVVWRS